MKKLKYKIARKFNQIQIPLLSLGLYDFLRIFIKGMIHGIISMRAAAVSYSLFLSLFPFLMFIFSIIPHLSFYEYIENSLQKLIISAFPDSSFGSYGVSYQEQLLKALTIFKRKDATILSTSIFLSIIFTTNGINALIEGMNNTIHEIGESKFFRQYFRAFLLNLTLTILFILLLILVYESSEVSKYIENGQWQLVSQYSENIRFGLGFSIFILFFFFCTLILYRFGPDTKMSFKQLIPGAIMATLLFILVFWGFTAYLKYFSKYQTLYSSIGVFIVILLWIYYSVSVILIGFEFNISIAVARKIYQDENYANFAIHNTKKND